MKRMFSKNDNDLVGRYIPFIITKGEGNLAEKAQHPKAVLDS
jgi:DNA polymerase elongation subunit (family B)